MSRDKPREPVTSRTYGARLPQSLADEFDRRAVNFTRPSDLLVSIVEEHAIVP